MKARWLLLCTVLSAAELQAQFAPELRGRVTDARSGDGLGDVDVRLESGERTRTSVDGVFLLRAATPGAHRLELRRIGYAPLGTDVMLINGTSTPLQLRLAPRIVQLQSLDAAAEVTPPNATVFTRAQIAARGARDVAELVEGTAGFVVTRRGGPGAPATLSVRGASANQVLVLVDGVPRNAALTGEADLSSITTADIERVTLLRGSESARYGPQALAGALLIETRRTDAASLELESAAGAFGSRMAAGRAGGEFSNSFSAAAAAEYQQNDNTFAYDVPAVRGGGVDDRRNADVRRLQSSATFGYADGERRLQFRADIADIDRGMPGSIVQPSLTGRQTDRRWTLQLGGALPAGPWRIDADLSLQRQRTRWQDSLPPFTSAYDDRASLRTWQARSGFSRAAGALTLSAGADARFLGIDASTLAAAAPGTLRYAGLYASAEHVLAARGLWRLALGIDARGDVGTLVDGVVLSPRMRVRAARGRAGLSASVGNGFAPPSPADLFFQDGVQVRPNPNLRPERVRRDLNLAFDLHGIALGAFAADVDVAAYRADIDGMILWAPNFRFIWSPYNADVARRGGEASLRLAHRSGRAALLLQSALTDVRYVHGVEDGQVSYRPRWSGSARLDLRVAKLEPALSWRYTGARRTAPSSEVNLLPAFGIADVRVQQSLRFGRETVRLRAGVENIFDTRAAMLFDFPLPGRLWTAGFAFTLPITRSTP